MAQPNQRCRVLSGFRHKGEIQGPGTVLDLEKPVALELRTANKVEFVASDEKLVRTDKLPDPNKKFAERQAARAAALAAYLQPTRAAAAGGK